MMEVLLCLASRPGESISKETIIKTVWPNRFVSDDALIRCVFELRHINKVDEGILYAAWIQPWADFST
jgi:DNA-binding winged helix-turn-helix (wHTH) protein